MVYGNGDRCRAKIRGIFSGNNELFHVRGRGHLRKFNLLLSWASILAVSLVLILARLPRAAGQTLTVGTQPSLAVGGEPFGVQPVVNFLDDDGNLFSTFSGYAYATLEESLSGFELLRYNGSTTSTDNMVPVVDGRASFLDLTLNEAGEGYKLRFIGLDNAKNAFAYVDSSSFSVARGSAYQISITRHPASATGGSPFRTQPLVAIQDRGFNILTNYAGSETVTVSMFSGSATLRSSVVNGLSANFYRGIASFGNLFINEAGGPYVLQFTFNGALAGETTQLSYAFTVGIGVAASLTFTERVSDGLVYAGKPFVQQPTLKVVDAGGNVLVGDSTSTVTVSIFDNPANGKLLPPGDLKVTVNKGIVVANNLNIDKAGLGYRLQYSLDGTDVSSLGNQFDVKPGEVTGLVVSQQAGDAWAGGQPFQIQPRIDLVDDGGNVITTDSTTVVTCTVVPSLAVGELIVIKTTGSPPVNITDVAYSATTLAKMSKESLGPGDVIEVNVKFSHEVTATFSSSKPYIELTHVSAASTSRAKAEVTNPNVRTRQLSFSYAIGNDLSSSDVGYYGVDALNVGDGSILDNLNRAVNDTLRPGTVAYSLRHDPGTLNVDNTRPKVVGIETSLPAGEYGAGHKISLDLNFSRSVHVEGNPILPLMVNNTVNVIHTNTTGNITAGSTWGITFNGHSRNNIPFDVSADSLKIYIEGLASVKGTVCVMREAAYALPVVGGFNDFRYEHRKPWSNGAGYNWIIQFNSLADDPSLGFSVNYAGMTFSKSGSPNKGDQGNMISRTVEVGKEDNQYITYDWATDAWTTAADSTCLTRFATYSGGSGTKNLRFDYVVMPGDSATFFDIHPNATIELPDPSEDAMLYSAPTPTLKAHLGMQGKRLAAHKDITIDTSAPKVDAGVGVVAFNTPDATYTVGDVLKFTIKFNKAVSLSADGILEMGLTGVSGSAVYVSGSGTDTLLFEYTVREFHTASDLDYASTTALSTSGTIRRFSDTPTTDAILTLPAVGSNLAANSDIVVQGDKPTIVSVAPKAGADNTVYTLGQDVRILVTFSQKVESKNGHPVLVLDVGTLTREATYVGGNNTAIFEFSYIVKLGDVASNLGYTFSAAALCLKSGCPSSSDATLLRVSSVPTLSADITTSTTGGTANNGVPIGTSIQVDTSAAPVTTVASISIIEPAGTYAVGSVIFVSVRFTDEVVISSGRPFLFLNLGGTGRKASYNGQGDGTDTLMFYFTVTDSDAVANLEWKVYPDHSKNSPFICEAEDLCKLLNRNGVQVNHNFTDPTVPASPIAQFAAGHVIDNKVPQILDVYSDKVTSPYCGTQFDVNQMNCTYTVGEEIDIFAKFSTKVSVTGEPRLKVISGASDRFLVYNKAKTTDTEVAFTYVVEAGDYTIGNLTYACSYPNNCDLDMTGGTASIKRQATIPTTPANYTMPLPNRLGLARNGNTIYINTEETPKVAAVGSISATGTYAPGDILTLYVDFTEVVVVTGTPLLYLELGLQDSVAHYVSGSDSRRLLFEYVVAPGESTLDLDYSDSHALKVGLTTTGAAGSILQKSTTPVVVADLKLPLVGAANSLGRNAAIKIDGSTPFVTAISSPQPSGEYGDGSVIVVNVEFSSAVYVAGQPYLVLETGNVDRLAMYHGGTNTSTLEFRYTVVIGDQSSDLDYRSVEESFRDATSSFVLNGGSIKKMSSRPILDADIHLNPGKGFVEGTTSVTASLGVVRFTDLKILQRGPNYKLRYTAVPASTGATLRAESSIYIDVSSEFEIMGLGREDGDRFGYSVDISDSLLIVGAPGKRNPIYEVQILDLYADTPPSAPINEIQVFETELDVEDAVRTEQVITSFADPHETVGGFFKVDIKNYGASTSLPVDISGEGLATFIEEEFPLLGKIEATRTNNVWCACNNAYDWTITFLDSTSMGNMEAFAVNSDEVTGAGAGVSPQGKIIKDRTFVGGTWSILNPNNGMKSRDISFDATADDIKAVFESDLGLGASSIAGITVGNKYNFEKDVPGLGRRWKVTFNTFDDSDSHTKRNVPNFSVDGAKLTGSDAYIWHAVGVEGQEAVNGNFTVSLRGSDPSAEIAVGSSSSKLKWILENTCDAVNEVAVARSTLSNTRDNIYGFSYTITFVSVNRETDYGWELDRYASSTGGNLPKIAVGASELYGSNAGYTVYGSFGYGPDENSAWFEDYRMGSECKNSGEAQISKKDDEQWVVEATLKADDANGNDLFGHSVSIHDDFALVGAPHKEVIGDIEQQLLNCTAKSGSFKIMFRGFESADIPHDASLDDLKVAVRDHMNPLKAVSIEAMGGWNGLVANGRGLCSGNHSVMFTFVTPSGGNSLYLNTTGDIEMLQWDETNLHEAHSSEPNQVEIKEYRKGSLMLNGDYGGKSATGAEAGCAYVFKRHSNCVGSICSYWWTQLTKMTPFDGSLPPQDNQEFGASVYAGENSGIKQALVGSPGADDSMGNVYFYRDMGTGFVWKQTLDATSWGRHKLDRFGHSLASSASILAVSAPGYNGNQGAVYIWIGHNSHPQFNYNPDQMITAPAGEGILPGDEFGCSIDVDGLELVICACKSDNDVIYTKTNFRGKKITNTGSCYVYERPRGATQFDLREKLVPTNMKKNDNFGSSVSITNGTIAVGQVVKFVGDVGTTRPQQEVVTYCDDTQGSCDTELGANFRISVKKDVEGGYLFTRSLSYQSDEASVRTAIEEDLMLGEVTVSRSIKGDKDRGYRWRITFNDYSDASLSMTSLPRLYCNATTMTGSFPACSTTVVNPIRNSVRSKVHIFQKNWATDRYTEECFLFPNIPQRQDMFGSTVALSGKYAIAGGWNRDLTNINSGAALAFDISFLDFKFKSSAYTVTEGSSIDLVLERSSSVERRVIGMRSLDRNAPQAYQNYVNQLYGVRTQEMFPLLKTVIDEVSGPTAFGRSQYYGSADNRSMWVDNAIDYRGISDYELLLKDFIVNIGELECKVNVKTTDDYIFEAPDENITVQLALPGIFPSQIGNLKTVVTIADDNDGVGPYSFRTYYEKFYGSDIEVEDAMGSSVDVDDEAGIMVVGSEFATYDAGGGVLYEQAGCAYIFNRTSGMWSESKVLRPPSWAAKAGAQFGASVAVDQPYGRNDVTVVVGAPGIMRAFVYVYNWNGTQTWTLQQTLRTTETIAPQDSFAGFRSVALSGDVVAVGCRGAEAVYVYYRTWSATKKAWEWSGEQKLYSSEYDYDQFDDQMTRKHVHRQDFGVSVALEGRTMIVGAPFADYGKSGTDFVEGFDTDGTDNVGLGKGKVFSFYSRPIVQRLSISAIAEPTQGQFKVGFLGHAGRNDNSTLLAFDASAAAFKAAIESSENIGEVSVTRELTNPAVGWGIIWTVTFLSEYDASLPNMMDSYRNKAGYNCAECAAFDTDITTEVQTTQTMTSMAEWSKFQAGDKKSGDRFGYSVALDGNQALVGAMFSSSKCRSTFDFETGDLVGWTKTGTAFDFQPTYGDNSRFRNVYGGIGDKLSHGAPQQSGIKGRYYIGTYEKRPGRGRDNYKNPSSAYRAGNSQGDEPEGTLTSDSFVILGDEVSFLIGGGCNHLVVYLELLVDGMSVYRATGRCHEKMERVTWDVSEYYYRAGQFRIVDSGSGPWDHINVDDIRLSWGGIGGIIDASGEMQHYMLQEGAPKSGCAYAFRLKQSEASVNHCFGNKNNCVWEQEERLVASDKRQDSLFGYSLDVDDTTGHAVIGAVGMIGMGIYRESLSTYPHYNPTRVPFPLASKYETYAQLGDSQAAAGGGNVRILTHVANTTEGLTSIDPEYSSSIGAIYIFTRKSAEVDGSGNIISLPVWKSTEDAKMYAPDGLARDRFGSSVALDMYTSVIGAVGVDGKGIDAGAAYLVDTEFQRVFFAKTEFVALEGTDSTITITVMRDSAHMDSILTVGYATSDLTATGIDSGKFAACEALPASQRDGCGDYQQESGEITFTKGSNSAVFTVKIMNDFCKERYMEYVQLTLNVPGGGGISGNGYMAVIRIDDNDWDGSASSMLCSGGIS